MHHSPNGGAMFDAHTDRILAGDTDYPVFTTDDGAAIVVADGDDAIVVSRDDTTDLEFIPGRPATGIIVTLGNGETLAATIDFRGTVTAYTRRWGHTVPMNFYPDRNLIVIRP